MSTDLLYIMEDFTHSKTVCSWKKLFGAMQRETAIRIRQSAPPLFLLSIDLVLAILSVQDYAQN